MRELSKAWAIKMHISGHPQPGFMGVFYCAEKLPESYRDGIRMCLFRTRKQAREAIKERPFYRPNYLIQRSTRPHVVRVKIIIKED